jgi:hypothetical protein
VTRHRFSQATSESWDLSQHSKPDFRAKFSFRSQSLIDTLLLGRQEQSYSRA